MTSIALQPDGALGYCQPSSDRPATGSLRPTDTSWTCVGTFLLAGAELARLQPDLALNHPVNASSQQWGNEATHAVDGDFSTRWSAYAYPQSLAVDLGGLKSVSNVSVVPLYDRAYAMYIEGTNDGVHWVRLADGQTDPVPGSRQLSFPSTDLTAVRLTITGIPDGSTSWVSIREFGVYGDG
jgi:hypothetical protein